MVDIVNPETRSRMMANIRGKDTTPELTVRKHLHKMGFRLRLNFRVVSTLRNWAGEVVGDITIKQFAT